MTQAIWNGAVLAASDRCKVVEGNYYFPPESVQREYLRPTDTHTVCAWKGTASYYDVVVQGEVSRDGAWSYPHPLAAAKPIKDYVAFGRDMRIDSSFDQ